MRGEILQKILDKTIDDKKVFGASFCMKHNDRIWSGSAGDLNNDSCYFIASVTKLFTTAVILYLRFENKLSLDDKICKYLDESILQGLHNYKGKDYSNEITIKNLLAHTSGLPDYFEDKNINGNSLESELLQGKDQYWSFERAIEITKTLPPHFKPSQKNKAYYSDSNFQLLGKIIENITGKSVSDNFQDLIINPLGLANTYLYKDISDNTPKVFYYKNKELHIPKAMTSFGADGGLVSTSNDLMAFIEAFFRGRLFPESYISELQVWNKIFFPLQSGIGIHRFRLIWLFNPFGKFPELMGHSGLSGALVYCSPKRNLYITGTVNQVAYPDISFKTAIKLIQKII